MNIIESYNKGQDRYFAEWNKINGYIVGVKIQDLDSDGESGKLIHPKLFDISLEEFIADFKDDYKVVETLAADKKVRELFWRWMVEHMYGEHCENDLLFAETKGDDGWDRGILKPTKQMLQGYWQEYIINKFREDQQ